MKKLLILIVVVLIIWAIWWWWGKAPILQAPTSGGTNEVSAINQELNSIDLGNVTSDFQGVDSDINKL